VCVIIDIGLYGAAERCKGRLISFRHDDDDDDDIMQYRYLKIVILLGKRFIGRLFMSAKTLLISLYNIKYLI